jgi:oligopeptide/dipeptide ABC transporter ATP-binding protein
MADGPLVSVRDVVKSFRTRDGGQLRAVDGVSIDIRRGATFGLVGESGSGKSTLSRCILRLSRPDEGTICFDGQDMGTLSGRQLRRLRSRIQVVFQDPHGSLNRRKSVAEIIAAPLAAHRAGSRGERAKRVAQLLELVQLPAAMSGRRPSELSGGQAQRVAIARALALDPALIIYDEAVSSLDVLIRAQVLNLLERLRSELSLTYLFIAHDLALVKQVSDRVAVMYLGKLVEIGPAESLYREPLHPYTVALLASIPNPDPAAPRAPVTQTIHGEPPSPIDPPSGCRFRTRCPRAQDVCAAEEPPLRKLADGHLAACHFPVSRAAAPALAGGAHDAATTN